MSKIISIIISAFLLFIIVMPTGNALAAKNECRSNSRSFFGVPTWDMYLEVKKNADGTCDIKINDVKDFWLIILAIVDILVRLSSLLAVCFVIYGGIDLTLSRGTKPEAVAKSRNTIINALIGMAITLSASQIVRFIATSIGGS